MRVSISPRAVITTFSLSLHFMTFYYLMSPNSEVLSYSLPTHALQILLSKMVLMDPCFGSLLYSLLLWFMFVPLTGCQSCILTSRIHAQTLTVCHYYNSLLLLIQLLVCVLSVSEYSLDQGCPKGGGCPGLCAALAGLPSSFILFFIPYISPVYYSWWCVCVSQSLRIIFTCNSTNYASVVIFVQFSTHLSKNNIGEVCDSAFQVSVLWKLNQIKG